MVVRDFFLSFFFFNKQMGFITFQVLTSRMTKRTAVKLMAGSQLNSFTSLRQSQLEEFIACHS